MTKVNIEGRKVFIDRNGVEVSSTLATLMALSTGEVRERINGPHHNAKWARHLAGAQTQSEVRRRNLNRASAVFGGGGS